ncbi:MAG: PHP domain-containing protein, partial [Treponema bryantii]|nr:PHP domain-containing protein [Treponema bryantii]
MIDLHIHTTASDGQYSPTELIQKAASKKITT